MNIHWHEGLFLQPHHLQRLQYETAAAARADRRLVHTYPYGVMEAELSADELANFRIRFTKLRVLMPGGALLDFPGNADLPAVDIRPLFAGNAQAFSVSVGIPLWQPDRANSSGIAPGEQPTANAKILYRVREENVCDENTGDNRQPVLTRRLNARLVLDGDDATDLELVPVLRLVRAAGEQLGRPRADPEYFPPALHVSGAPALRARLGDLVNQLEASRRELLAQINRGGFNMEMLRGGQFGQLLRLLALNRAAARLSALNATAAVTPFAWYLELRALHAELAALHPEKDDYDVPGYLHENLFATFSQLDVKIRALLRGANAATFLRLAFAPAPDGTFETAFTDEHLERGREFFLALRPAPGGDPRALAALVEDGNRFKLMPKSMAARAIRGVELREDRFPPPQFPAAGGVSFFRLASDETSRVWQQIKTEKALTLRLPEQDLKIAEITLFMTVAD